ncbi:MAG TPA: class II aldolase/adducin family protein [Gemmatimonadaceae bacterium]|nr:class II aldolase/adducin family protein [Gemmatimonadaceae bacterium]
MTTRSGTLAQRRAIVAVCRRLYERGLIAGPDGNVSVRLGPDRVLVTPSGMSKVDVRPGDLVEVALDGTRRTSRAAASYREASSEVYLHLRMYSRRPDVMAVVHAHPPVATGFAVAGETLPGRVLPELIVQMGDVALVPFALPGGRAIADALEPYVRQHDAFLLANHGAVTVGPSLETAHQRMESVEHAARIVLAARLIGNVNELTAEQVTALGASRAAKADVQSRSTARSSRRGKA